MDTKDRVFIREYRTSHMPLVAYLKMQGCTLQEITVEGTRGVFTFSGVPRDLLIAFNSSKALVEPNEFAEKMSQLTQSAKRAIQINGD